MDASLKIRLRHRLLSLSRGWDKLKTHGWDVVSLASKEDFESPGDPVTISFYPKNAASSSKGDASVTMDLSGLSQHMYADELAEKARDSGMPVEEHFSASIALRISYMQDRKERRGLLAARLMAMAAFG
jgi:E3 ubiquitin-protein ligase HUWE1